MSQVKENIKQLLRELTDVVAVSGQEQEMVKALSAHLQHYVDKLEVDPTGNLTAIKKGALPGPSLMLLPTWIRLALW